MERYEEVSAAPSGPATVPDTAALRDPSFPLPTFRSGRVLRAYQETGVRWMVHNYAVGRNCILGDEVRGGERLGGGVRKGGAESRRLL